jgi:hypothetical protein
MKITTVALFSFESIPFFLMYVMFPDLHETLFKERQVPASHFSAPVGQIWEMFRPVQGGGFSLATFKPFGELKNCGVKQAKNI